MVPSENKYLYNGKELQDEQLGGVNLDWYDYGARFYDPALGRF
jgi:RHS repeat-associated protein